MRLAQSYECQLMRILACSYAFHPSVGGIETVTQLLCKEWVRMGHQVTIVTHTEGDPLWEGLYCYRRPNFRLLQQLIKRCDIFWQSNISLSYLLPWLLVQKPWFTTAHLWPSLTTRFWSPKAVLKHCAQFFTHNIYVSKVVSKHHLWPGVIIPNPVDIERWKASSAYPRDRDVVFVGRLFEGKGCGLLIESLALLNSKGQCPLVSIIGHGPQKPDLERLVSCYKLENHVTFLGALHGYELAMEVGRHRLAVIPSIWEEPFGVVVLEAIAAGCVPLFSPMGGLSDAAGPCGVPISSLSPIGLADTISATLLNYEASKQLLDQLSPSHLEHHSVARIAAAYIQLFESATL